MLKYFNTIIRLLREARHYAKGTGTSWWPVAWTLSTLHVKSKFTRPDDRIVAHTIGPFRVYGYQYSTLIQLYRQIFLQRVYHFSSSTAQPFIIDCGANIGMTVLYFKTCYPQSEIWAFEPNPQAFALLKRNVEQNQLSNVRLFPYALAEQDGYADFYLPPKRGSVNGSSMSHYRQGTRITVETKKLSGLLSRRQVDFLKIDVEGDEEKIIRDLNRHMMLKDIEKIAIEYHEINFYHTPLAILTEAIQKKGFVSELRSPSHPDSDKVVYFKKQLPYVR